MVLRVFPGLLCILLALTASGNITSIQTCPHHHDLQNAADFLWSQYNHTLHLLAEAPHVAKTVYWLWNDNYLGYHALRVYYPEIASSILGTLQRYEFPKNYAYEALFGQTVALPFRSPENYTIENRTDYAIKLDIYNGSTLNDWQNYSNLLCLAALSHYWRGDITLAVANFSKAVTMWNGTGITDAANDDPKDKDYKRYAVYKLALLVYTAKILGQPLDFHRDAENIIWQMQNKTNFGIHTDYVAFDSNGSGLQLDPNGSDVNVETTALAIGAYRWAFPQLSELPYKASWGSCLVLVGCILLKTFRGSRKKLRRGY